MNCWKIRRVLHRNEMTNNKEDRLYRFLWFVGAAGVFNIEEPDEVSTEITSAPRPTIAARRAKFNWREEEGI